MSKKSHPAEKTWAPLTDESTVVFDQTNGAYNADEEDARTSGMTEEQRIATRGIAYLSIMKP